MFSRIKLWKIINAHLSSLRALDQKSGIFWKDKLTYFYFPAFLGLLFGAGIPVDIDTQLANLIAVISIFGGFLLNLLAVINGYLDRVREKEMSPIRKKYAKEINSNISFCILLSVFSVIFLIIFGFIPKETALYTFKKLRIVLTTINIFLFVQFILTLLLVLSRVFLLLDKENENL